MTSITVLGGERTIGGTLILVEERGARLLFDCGMPYNPAADHFSAVRRRSGRELSDLIVTGLVPYIPGVFAPQFTEHVPASVRPIVAATQGPVAVALSHSHLDHAHLAGFVDVGVPLHASAPTARIVDLLGRTGRALGGPPSSLHACAEFAVGSISVRFLPVDHDVCGARGMLIETSDGIIAYSGDLRLHGSHPEYTLGFARAACESGASVLILEGTRLGATPTLDPALPIAPDDRVEDDVAPEIARGLRAIPDRLGIVLLTPENGERVEALASAASTAERMLVMDPRSLAFTVAALGRPMNAPHAIYAGSTSDTHEDASVVEGRVSGGTTQTLRVSTADLARAPGQYLLELPFGRFAELLDIRNACDGGAVFASNGPPLGRFDPAWASLEWWAGTLGLDIIDAGCSGHASAHDLALIARHSRAPMVMCIHSHQPELLPISANRLLLPERGRPYDLSAMQP